MVEQEQPKAGGIETFVAGAGTSGAGGRRPVHLWNPPFCGDIDMRVAADGTWFYQGSPIRRPALVRFFASILKREDGKYYLVTPVEKVGIRVDDVPFRAVEMKVEMELNSAGRTLTFRTDVDDWVACGADHALRFEPDDAAGVLKPYLHVRDDLWARVVRSVFYDLVELGEEREVAGEPMFGVASRGAFFAMMKADQLRDLA
jgi:hypothetical protein